MWCKERVQLYSFNVWVVFPVPFVEETVLFLLSGVDTLIKDELTS
jgi:hypothetical protein